MKRKRPQLERHTLQIVSLVDFSTANYLWLIKTSVLNFVLLPLGFSVLFLPFSSTFSSTKMFQSIFLLSLLKYLIFSVSGKLLFCVLHQFLLQFSFHIFLVVDRWISLCHSFQMSNILNLSTWNQKYVEEISHVQKCIVCQWRKTYIHEFFFRMPRRSKGLIALSIKT